ncbi:MAG: PAS domain S-box protein [Blastochloris viridis]|uniref:PAS domain S-box protein n=1 Tax=Blastochloris viridis TaxID=1079 RepID=A0A6N4QY01_BLAVI|nr:MAG: PAS domain S-box protein [Blastochloris viridis]
MLRLIPQRATDHHNIMSALDKSQAIIHFDTSGKIQWANQNFLDAMGYRSEDVIGQHHQMFVEPEYAQSKEYQTFWENLRQGKFQASQYKRIGKGGKEVYIQASYNPIFDTDGKPYKIVKVASDVTTSVLKTKNAFDKVQALIHFSPDGTILDANENFLKSTGYSLEEIKGRHHSMFCDGSYVQSPEYKEFWNALNRGEIQTGEFRRVGKQRQDIWLQASYTVKYDNNGEVVGVIKYASDITPQKRANMESNQAIEAVTTSLQELTSSIADISSSTNTTRDAVEDVQRQSDAANSSVTRLLQSAEAMSEVLVLIQNISGQINLLALNAAIEAARAGDAGRGFAVVADEVKRLASQAEESTDKINDEIKGIQSIADAVATSLGQIQQSIQGLVESSNTVASAVEEQSVVTAGIADNMTRVTELINSNGKGNRQLQLT